MILPVQLKGVQKGFVDTSKKRILVLLHGRASESFTEEAPLSRSKVNKLDY